MAFQNRRLSPDFSIALAVFLLSSTCNSHDLYITEPDVENRWLIATSVYDFIVVDNTGRQFCMDEYRGYVLIIVNIEDTLISHPDKINDLNKLNDEFFDLGVRILAFPVKGLFKEAPDYPKRFSLADLMSHKMIFDVMKMITINGPKTHPLWKYIKFFVRAENIYEHFTKIIIDRNGMPIRKVGPNVDPLAFTLYLKDLL